MSTEQQVETLRSALLARAKVLADETVRRGRREAERITAETETRLRSREESEHLAAKARAERIYRQKVQAAEIRLRAELDQLRWTHVQQVVNALLERITILVDDEPAYFPLLKALLANAARTIEDDDLVAEVNARDYTRLHAQWPAIVAAISPDKRIVLSPECHECSGGILVRNDTDTIRVDNRFEGRLERLGHELERVIVERLFASTAPPGRLS